MVVNGWQPVENQRFPTCRGMTSPGLPKPRRSFSAGSCEELIGLFLLLSVYGNNAGGLAPPGERIRWTKSKRYTAISGNRLAKSAQLVREITADANLLAFCLIFRALHRIVHARIELSAEPVDESHRLRIGPWLICSTGLLRLVYMFRI